MFTHTHKVKRSNRKEIMGLKALLICSILSDDNYGCSRIEGYSTVQLSCSINLENNLFNGGSLVKVFFQCFKENLSYGLVYSWLLYFRTVLNCSIKWIVKILFKMSNKHDECIQYGARNTHLSYLHPFSLSNLGYSPTDWNLILLFEWLLETKLNIAITLTKTLYRALKIRTQSIKADQEFS